MPRRFATPVLAGLLVLAWAAAAQSLSLRGIEFPETLAGYKRGPVQAAARNCGRRGAAVDYVGKALTARVFVYGEGKADPEGAPDPGLLNAEFKTMLQAEEQDVKRGKKGQAMIRGMRAVYGPNRQERFLEAEMLLTKDKKSRTVYLYLGQYAGQFLKITVNNQSRVSGARGSRLFIQALSNHLWPAEPKTPPAEADTGAPPAKAAP